MTQLQTAPARFLNRELSWLKFNERVLSEAARTSNPLLERARFLSIFESNLNEFYMVRVSGLIEQEEAGSASPSFDGLTPEDQLEMIAAEASRLRLTASDIWTHDLEPALAEAGVTLQTWKTLSERNRAEMAAYFEKSIFPLCTPLILDPNPATPFISNLSLNLAVLLEAPDGSFRLGRVKIPDGTPRAIRLSKRRHDYLPLEELIRAHLASLYRGMKIAGSWLFRVVRDADVEIREMEAGDLIDSIEESLRERKFGAPVLLEVSADMPEETRTALMRVLDLDRDDVVAAHGLLDMRILGELASIEKRGLRFAPHVPYQTEKLASATKIFASVKSEDLLLHQPYDSFQPVQSFVDSAAADPNVLGVKQTLYRVGVPSPIVESLLQAANSGKQAAVMVELKARFDEVSNLAWARALDEAGVHVALGVAELKTHCKLCLIVRKEAGQIQTYAHIGTGNYNPSTARLYTDFGLFTADPEITRDVAELFNFLTAHSPMAQCRRLLVAPVNLRQEIARRIRAEADRARTGGPARIWMKMNSLVDPAMIDELYAASEAGVDVRLIVRGICCLRPGIPGLSERIQVISVVGRFLEHSRMFWFENGGDPDVFIGSADLMTRNLDRRVEVLCPVQSPKVIRYVRDVFDAYWRDNTNAWELDANGEYALRTPGSGEPFAAQEHLMKHSAARTLLG